MSLPHLETMTSLRSSQSFPLGGALSSSSAMNLAAPLSSSGQVDPVPLLKCGLEPPSFPHPPSWIIDAVADAYGRVDVLGCGLDDTLADVAARVAVDRPHRYACKTIVADVTVWFSLKTTTLPDMSKYQQGVDIKAAEQDALVTTVAGFLRMLEAHPVWVTLPSHDLELEASMSFPSLQLTPHVLIGDLLREYL